jgi:hypothetical protein
VASISVASSTLSIVAFMYPHSFVNADRHMIAFVCAVTRPVSWDCATRSVSR